MRLVVEVQWRQSCLERRASTVLHCDPRSMCRHQPIVCNTGMMLRCGVRVHELKDMRDIISVWPDRGAA
jgi:hypothetical protein